MDQKERINFLVARCIALFKRRPRTEQEVRLYLRKKKESMETINAVVKSLKFKKIIDDRYFVNWWIEQRNYFKPRGKAFLKSELKAHGVQSELIAAILETADLDEEKMAQNALSKIIKRLSSLDGKNRKQKALQYLLRRGFSYAVSKKTIEDLRLLQ